MHNTAFTVRSAIVTLALAAAACGGGQPSTTSESQPAAAPPSAVPAGATRGVIGEWDQARYVVALEQNRYGDKQASLLRQEAGHVVFAPKTAQDHVATPFVSVGSAASVDLVLQADSAEGDACVATLQDQAYKVLGTLPCAGTGERKTSVKTSGNVTRVRVFFQSPKAESQQLPTRIQIVTSAG